jgi:hypothetical protein
MLGFEQSNRRIGKITCCLLTACILLASHTAFSDAEPSVHDIYEAKQAGHADRAKQMVNIVLQNHPGSSKAHYISAEIYASEGKIALGRSQFGAAERLDPTLSFAKAQAVQNLKAALGPPGNDFIIGNKSIALPDVARLAANNSDDAISMARATLSSNKQLLKVWSPPLGDKSGGALPTAFRYADAYVFSGADNESISYKDFERARQIVSRDISDLQTNETLPAPTDVPELDRKLRALRVDPGAVSYKAKLLAKNELKDRLTYILLTEATTDAIAPSKRVLSISCMNTLLLKDKIVTLNVYAQYNNEDDVAWLAASCSDLVTATMEANI